MTGKLSLCPKCREGCIRPISEVTSDSDKSPQNIKFYECDNQNCRYRTVGTSVWEQTYDADSEPIVCSKCQIRFNTELELKRHYDEKHDQKTNH